MVLHLFPLARSSLLLRLIVAATVLICTCSGSAIAQTWPNNPTGSQVVADCDFNDGSKTCGGTLTTYYPGGGVTDLPDAPYSPGGVYYDSLPPGATTGNASNLTFTGSRNMKDMYVGFYWKMNSDFEGLSTCNKLFFMRDFGSSQAGCNTNGTFLVCGHDGVDSRNFPYDMIFSHNTGNLDNSHTCSLDLGLACFGNITKTPIYPDTWYLVEGYVKASTTATSRDGILRWWIDGVLQGNYEDFNYGCGTVNEFVFAHTWDGSHSTQCRQQNGNPLSRDCTREWFHYMDHLFITTPDCPDGCPVTGNTGSGSGGGVDISPPPMPEPEGCPPVPDIKIRTPQNSTPAINLGPNFCKNGYEIFGLPPICSLSAGTYDAARDTWDLEAGDAAGLTVSCPNFCGKMEFTVIPKNDP